MKKIKSFPNGATKCVTFSFDDGAKEDIRLSKLFNKYNMKCTFNLSDCLLRVMGDDFLETYFGHEVACHGAEHLRIVEHTDEEIIKEITFNRKNLEALTGYSVKGHAYAGGYHDDHSIEVLKKCGIVYGRTTMDTGEFGLPTDFLRWHPTCQQKHALEFAQKFVNTENDGSLKLLYIWGHSFEFREEKDWETFENALKILAKDKDIWYATNMEVYNFINNK